MTWTVRSDDAAAGRRGGGPSNVSAGAPGVLADIVASVKRDLPAAKARMPQAALERLARDRAPRAELFVEALSVPGRTNVIAECKRRSPSAGALRAHYLPGRIAEAYERAGAVAVSVLTEPKFFGGALDHLAEVREAVDLPVLRKDFIVDAYQLVEARAAGADAALLIAAALDDRELGRLIAEARLLGLAALVEVHDESDLHRALEWGATIIGVNNRSLRTLEVDLTTSARLVGRLPKGVVAVAESGIRSPEDLARLRECGYQAFLIGGHLMTSPEPGAALAELLRAADSAAGRAGGDARCG